MSKLIRHLCTAFYQWLQNIYGLLRLGGVVKASQSYYVVKVSCQQSYPVVAQPFNSAQTVIDIQVGVFSRSEAILWAQTIGLSRSAAIQFWTNSRAQTQPSSSPPTAVYVVDLISCYSLEHLWPDSSDPMKDKTCICAYESIVHESCIELCLMIFSLASFIET